MICPKKDFAQNSETVQCDDNNTFIAKKQYRFAFMTHRKRAFENFEGKRQVTSAFYTLHNLGCQKIRPQEDSAQRRPAIFEKIRPRRREDSAPRLRRFGPPYAIVFLSVYFCNMFISFK